MLSSVTSEELLGLQRGNSPCLVYVFEQSPLEAFVSINALYWSHCKLSSDHTAVDLKARQEYSHEANIAVYVDITKLPIMPQNKRAYLRNKYLLC